MTEKARCIDCGKSIVATTVGIRGGRCLKCYRTHRGTVAPDDFSLPAELQDSVAESELDAAFLRNVAWIHGVGEMKSLLRLEEKTKELKCILKPRLIELAAEDRYRSAKQKTGVPVPKLSEMRRVLGTKLGDGPTVHPLRVGICTLPHWAMDIAESQWASSTSTHVLLTPDATSAWNSLYQYPDESYWWFSLFCWGLEDSPSRHSKLDGRELWAEEEIPEECEPWLVRIGETHGPLQGRGWSELWVWNGTEASCVREVDGWIS